MQVVVGDIVSVSQPTVCRILAKVCTALMQHLATYVKMPETEHERQLAAAAFYQIAGFPRTIGAIDCTHVKVQYFGGPMVSASADLFVYEKFKISMVCFHLQSEVYRNRKGYFATCKPSRRPI